MKQLKGITWNHSRGFTSIVACSQRFSELNPGVDIKWDKRSLQAFADEPIDKLAERYDFLIIDHPWAGFAARTNVILPLDDYLPESFLQDQKTNSVGKSFESYSYNGKQWALAIDAATPVASSRLDLFKKEGQSIPITYADLIALSKTGKVAIPGIPQDTLMSFYMICSTLGEDVCQAKDRVVSEKVGLKALRMLRELGVNISRECYDWNPIKVYEAMTLSDDYLYCPFAYGYTNYARKGYARKELSFHDMVSINGKPLITTLGGTGLAISAKCGDTEWATKFLQFAGSSEIQKGVFFDHSGQPGHKDAWFDEHTNLETGDFFKNTYEAHKRAFLRPRYHGHMYFQDRAGAPIRDYMINGGDEFALLEKLNKLYIESLQQ